MPHSAAVVLGQPGAIDSNMNLPYTSTLVYSSTENK